MDNDCERFNIFLRKSASGNNLLEIFLKRNGTFNTYNIEVKINTIIAGVHGQFNLQLDQFYRVTIAFYRNWNIFKTAVNPGMTLFDIIISPTMLSLNI
jgi:hypothetical protein